VHTASTSSTANSANTTSTPKLMHTAIPALRRPAGTPGHPPEACAHCLEARGPKGPLRARRTSPAHSSSGPNRHCPGLSAQGPSHPLGAVSVLGPVSALGALSALGPLPALGPCVSVEFAMRLCAGVGVAVMVGAPEPL